jgi:hypothetical protein
MIAWDPGALDYRFTDALAEAGFMESDLAWTTAQGSALRNLVVGNGFKKVAYVGAELALGVESALDGLRVDVRYIPSDGRHVDVHLEGWL